MLFYQSFLLSLFISLLYQFSYRIGQHTHKKILSNYSNCISWTEGEEMRRECCFCTFVFFCAWSKNNKRGEVKYPLQLHENGLHRIKVFTVPLWLWFNLFKHRYIDFPLHLCEEIFLWGTKKSFTLLNHKMDKQTTWWREIRGSFIFQHSKRKITFYSEHAVITADHQNFCNNKKVRASLCNINSTMRFVFYFFSSTKSQSYSS